MRHIADSGACCPRETYKQTLRIDTPKPIARAMPGSTHVLPRRTSPSPIEYMPSELKAIAAATPMTSEQHPTSNKTRCRSCSKIPKFEAPPALARTSALALMSASTQWYDPPQTSTCPESSTKSWVFVIAFSSSCQNRNLQYIIRSLYLSGNLNLIP